MLGLFFLRASESGGKATSLKLTEFTAVSRRFWPGTILLVDFAFGVCMTAPFIFVASFIDDAGLRLPGLSVIGIFFVCYAGLAIVIRLATRRLPDRIGAPRVLLVGAVFMSLGMLCFAMVDSSRPWLIVVPALMAGIGHSLMFHTMTSLTLRTFPSEVRGTGTAIALIMLDLGTIVGAPTLGWIGEQYGFATLFASIGVFCMLSCTCYGLNHRESLRGGELKSQGKMLNR
jgi:MFS family permease